MNLELIKNTISKALNVTEDFCDTKSRKKELVDARHIYCFVLKQIYPKLTYEKLGEITGNRDHSSAIFSIKNIKDLRFTNKEMRILIDEIIYSLKDLKEEHRISKLLLAINVIDNFLYTGKYNAVSTIKDVKGKWYCISTDDYIWNDDTTISKIISYYTDKGIVIRYISNYIAFHESNFI